jgi:t-SNARE complex subunit (syntaxin)
VEGAAAARQSPFGCVPGPVVIVVIIIVVVVVVKTFYALPEKVV